MTSAWRIKYEGVLYHPLSRGNGNERRDFATAESRPEVKNQI